MPEKEPSFEPGTYQQESLLKSPENKSKTKNKVTNPHFLQEQFNLPEEKWDEAFRQLIKKESKENQQMIKESMQSIDKESEGDVEKSEETIEMTFERYSNGLGLSKDELKEKRILDLGSRDGEFIKYIIRENITKEAYGIDTNPKKSLLKGELKKHFFKGDFQKKLPVKNLDYVVSVGAVSNAIWGGEELQNIESIINNSLTSLKNGGEIRIFPIEDTREESPLEGIKKSKKKWDSLVKKFSEKEDIECSIEPRSIKVIGKNNDIILESVLIIRKTEDKENKEGEEMMAIFDKSKPELSETKSEKELVWEKTRGEIEGIGDSLGMPIDEGIKETVIAFMVNGFPTSGSCEGHVDRALPVPWVEISAQNEPEIKYKKQEEVFDRIAKRHNFTTQDLLQWKNKDAEKAYWEAIDKCVKNGETKEYKKWVEENKKLRKEMETILNEFYQDKEIDLDIKLKIRPIEAIFRVYSGSEEDYRDFIKYNEEVSEERKQKRAEKLVKYKAEMDAFTEFLKQKYFQQQNTE